MKRTVSLLALAALTACTATPEMIEAQKGRCTQLGYTAGTEAHAQCAERGTMQQQQTQNAVAGSIGATVVNAAILNAIF